MYRNRENDDDDDDENLFFFRFDKAINVVRGKNIDAKAQHLLPPLIASHLYGK